jgi:hypothetical protein
MRRLAPLLLVAACAAPSQDPARAGFFDGLSNLASGTYTQRVEAREQRLAAEQAQALEARAAAAEAERGAQASGARLRGAEVRLAQLDAELASTRRRITALDAERAAGLTARADALAAERRAAGSAPDAATLAELERQQRALDAAVGAAFR